MQEEQSDLLDPDEPHTPGWLTLLGLGLFLAAGIFFLVTAGDEEDSAPSGAATPPDDAADSNLPPSED